MEEYLENIGTFYDEKVKFLSQKDKFLKCNGCPENKTFKESYEELSISCGGGDNKCGTQLIIKLPKYLNYEKTLDKLQDYLDSQIHWKVINKYIDVDGLENKNDMMQKIKDEIKKIETKFIELNIKNKESMIQDFYNDRIKKTKRCNSIKEQLQKSNIDPSKKKELREEYINLVIELNNEYIKTKEIIDNVNPFLLIEDPEITIKNDKNIVSNKKQPLFSVGDKVKYEIKDKVFEGEVIEIKDKKLIIMNDKNKKVFIPTKKCTKIEKNEYLLELKDEESIVESPTYAPGSPAPDSPGTDKSSEPEPEPKPEEPEPGPEEPEPGPEEPEESEINYFSGSKKYKWLSAFNMTNPDTDETLNPFKYDDIEYPSVEHAFHAQKIEVGHPKEEEYKLIFSTMNDFKPNEAKRFGSRKYFEDNNFKLRNDWGKIKLNLMKNITKEYYLSNPGMIDKLAETGNKQLIHKGFRIDNYWGMNKNGGENNHGKILMELRKELIQ